MNDNDIKTLPQVRAFLDGTRAVEFSMHSKSERYDFVRRALIRLAYHTLSKPDKGVVLSFLVHVSGYSRIQVKRLVTTWLKHGKLRPSASANNGFTRKYTEADRRLLAELDELHETQVLAIVYRVLATHLIHKAGFTHATARTGAVTLIQRFGGALNLNPNAARYTFTCSC